MRILILPSWYPTPSKPVNGVFVRDQADLLHQTHDVRVLYLDVLPRGHRGRPIRRVSTKRGYVEQTVQVANRPLIWQFTYLLSLYREYLSLRKRFAPDLVHCHVAVPAGWAAITLRRVIKVPLLLTEHTGQFEPWLQRPGLRWMAQRAFSGADAVIAVGPGQQENLRRSFKRMRRIEIVPNAVDTASFVPTPMPHTNNGYRLLFVGLLDPPPVKGLHILLDALALVRQRGGPKVRLSVIGDGALRPQYERQAHQLGLNGAVAFLGFQPRAKIIQHLQQSHALVLSSLSESQSIVVLEALASGRPVVATRCGGPEYVIDETNGLTADPGSADSLADAILRLLTHLDRYDPWHIAARVEDEYSYQSINTKLSQIYSSLLA